MPDADVVFLKEGVFEDTVSFNPSAENGVQKLTWNGVTIVDELDECEIRSAAGTTFARVQRDTSFPEPVTAEELAEL